MKKTLFTYGIVFFTTINLFSQLNIVEEKAVTKQPITINESTLVCDKTKVIQAKELQRLENLKAAILEKKELKSVITKNFQLTEQKKQNFVKQKTTFQSSNVIRNSDPVSLPFFEDFASESETEQNWTFLNLNEDDGMWYWNDELGPDGEEGTIHYEWNSDNPADDWAILNTPLIMEAGSHFVDLWYMTWLFPESFEIYIGTDFDYSTMTKIGGVENFDNEYVWENYHVVFNIVTAGNYYFGIKATSEADMFVFFIDDITIDAIGGDDVYTLPFFEDFATDGTLRWDVIDANEDFATWYWDIDLKDEPGRGGMGYLGIMADGDGDDYFVIKKPVALESGSNFFELYYFTVFGEESFEIYYGESSNVYSMEKIGGVSNITNFDWFKYGVTFEAPNAGNYFFAIKATSLWAGAVVLWVTDITIDAGVYDANPDITIDNIILPIGGNILGTQEEIGVIVYNDDLGVIESFVVTYSINGEEENSETFIVTVPAKNYATVYLTEKFDFSDIGIYSVFVSVSCEDDTNLENNDIEVYFKTKEPAEIPYHNLLLDEIEAMDWQSDLPLNWEWTDSNLENLGYGMFYANVPSVLYTDAIDIEEGVYTISFYYHGGYNFFGLFQFEDEFKVLIGKADESYENYELIHHFIEIYSYQGTTPIVEPYSGLINVLESGLYRIAFVSIELSSTMIGDLKIEKAPDHDVAITFISATPTQIPVTQIYNAETEDHIHVSLISTFANKGSNSENVTVELEINETYLGEVDIYELGIGEEITLCSSIPLHSAEKGESINFKFKAIIENDENPEDNEAEASVYVDETFAWDNCNYWGSGLGSNTAGFGLGTKYKLVNSDYLKSVSILWIPLNNDLNFDLNVFKVQSNQIVGEPLYSETVIRPSSIQGIYTYDFTPIYLEPGEYYFEVYQTGIDNIVVAYDKNPYGHFYFRETGETTIEPYVNPDWGFLGIRANFIAEDIVFHTVTVTANEGGQVEIVGYENLTEEIEEGKEITVMATSFDNYIFLYWTNEESGIVWETAEFTFTVTEDVTLVANFTNIDAINITEITQFTIYPNPVNDLLRVVCNATGNAQIEILTIAGSLVMTKQLDVKEKEINIDVSKLISGTYFIRLTDKSGSYVNKFVKK